MISFLPSFVGNLPSPTLKSNSSITSKSIPYKLIPASNLPALTFTYLLSIGITASTFSIFLNFSIALSSNNVLSELLSCSYLGETSMTFKLPIVSIFFIKFLFIPIPSDNITIIEAAPITTPKTVKKVLAFRLFKLLNPIVTKSLLVI